MLGEVMGVSVEYDNNVERRCTHPLLMPKMEAERISAADGEILEKVAIVVPARLPARKPKKGILRGDRSKSIVSASEAEGETKECVGRRQICSGVQLQVEACERALSCPLQGSSDRTG